MNRVVVSTIAACGTLMTYGLSISAVGPVIDGIGTTYGVGTAETGLLFTLLSGGYLGGILMKGTFLRSWSLRKTALVAQGGISLSLLAFSFSSSLWQGLLLFTSIGIAGGLIQVFSNTAIALLHSERRDSMLNVLHLFFGVGALTGPLVAGYPGLDGNWGYPFLLIAIFGGAVAMLLLLSRYPVIDRPAAGTSDKGKGYLRDPFVWLLALGMLLYMGSEMGLNSWSVLYLQQEHAMPRFNASQWLSFFWLFMTLGRMLSMYLAARIHTSLLLVLYSFSAVLSTGVFMLSGNATVAGIGLAAIGFSFAGTYPFLIGLGSSRHPEEVPQVTTLLVAAAAAGFMFFPWFTGYLGGFISIRAGLILIWGVIGLLLLVSLILRALNGRAST